MKKSELRQLIREEIKNLKEKLSPERQKRLDSLIGEFRSATDPDNEYYDYEGRDEDEIVADIRNEFGDTIAQQVDDGSHEMHFGKRYSRGYGDKADMRQQNDANRYRVTKSGKMNKQDVNRQKNYYKRGY